MRAARALILLLAGLAAATAATNWAAVAHAQTPPPGVQYLTFLHDALDAMPPGDSVPPTDPALDRVRAPLRAARDLSPGPAAIDPILGDLARTPADLRAARTDLQTLIAAVDLPAGSVAGDPHAATNTLHDVYNQPQFSGLGARPQNNDLFSRIGRALLDFFRWLFSNTLGHLGLIPSILVAALVIGAILAFVLLRLQRTGTHLPRRAAAAAEPRTGGTDPDAEWRLATDAAARADHREAVRHAFRSALLSVAVAGRLRVDAAWTTSELLARARGDADLVAALAPAADSFDRAWYSGRPVSQQDWEVARERCLAVRQLAGRRRVAS